MISLPGLLIEHLISGAITLLWIFISCPSTFPKQEIQSFGIFLVPVAYILGMLIDCIAFVLTYWFKTKVVRKFAEYMHYRREENVFDLRKSQKVKALIEHQYKDIQNQMDMRSSRDRVARGMIVNAIGMLIFMPIATLPMALKVFVLSAAIATWFFHEYISHKFFLRIYDRMLKEI
ncbi:hypothetical protein [Dawidia soli]|uniref:Glycosyl-4,4'-diaponeurosporenoate acyltransferase n=1 Tax=Dawidia soli TaxID=2782352 RepID=A0AAP2GFF6_9BACT|nr:hypothetical protein [Dawidia soli]MBT1689452.1 hypothetical protein [Dawidia soli]